MAKYPKLHIKRESRESSTEILDFEQARHLPFGKGSIVVIEGKLVNSYDEFLKLFTCGKYNSKEYLDILLLPLIIGG